MAQWGTSTVPVLGRHPRWGIDLDLLSSSSSLAQRCPFAREDHGRICRIPSLPLLCFSEVGLPHNRPSRDVCVTPRSSKSACCFRNCLCGFLYAGSHTALLLRNILLFGTGCKLPQPIRLPSKSENPLLTGQCQTIAQRDHTHDLDPVLSGHVVERGIWSWSPSPASRGRPQARLPASHLPHCVIIEAPCQFLVLSF